MFTEANVSKKNAQKKWIRLFPREYLDLFGSNWKLAWQVFASSKAANDASTAASATFFVWAWRGEADWSEAGLSGLSLKRWESVLGKSAGLFFRLIWWSQPWPLQKLPPTDCPQSKDIQPQGYAPCEHSWWPQKLTKFAPPMRVMVGAGAIRCN